MEIFDSKFFEVIASLVLTVVLIILRQTVRIIIKRHVQKNNLDLGQRKYANKFFSILLTAIFILGISLIWNITLKGLSIYFASIFTIVGVALFANWSFLSNITSSIILFFNSPLRIGSDIEIMDAEHTIRGKVVDINFFNIQILALDGNTIFYPNNLAIQKPIKQLKK